MKILIINTVPTDKNGITNVIFNYIKAMAGACLFDYVAINTPDRYYIDTIENQRGTIFSISRRSVLSYISKLYSITRTNKYDAIHIHGNSHTVLLELLVSKFAGCKVRIVHAHSTNCGSIVLHKLLQLPFDLLCTNRIACGDMAGKFMFGNKPFTVVNNGVDTDKFAFRADQRNKIRKRYGFEGCNVIGHVGYFSKVKNHSWIIEVFRSLLEKQKNYRLILIGDGELRGEIEDKAKCYGILDSIRFTGNINNVDEVLNAIDMILMPSLFEGLPLTLIEQQANGLQCVCSDAITNEVDKTGNLRFLSLNNSAEEWASEMDSFLDTSPREERSRIAIEKIRETGYSIQEEADKLLLLYNNALSTNNTSVKNYRTKS